MNHLNRRLFLGTVAASAGVMVTGLGDDLLAADSPRKFTMDLVCGAIGVGADQRRAIQLAQQGGFESVQPSPQELAQLSEGQLSELLGTLREANLVWGAAGMPVEFRGDDAAFLDGMKTLPSLAKALRQAGGTRMSTWLSPSHDELTYTANFQQHATRLREVAKVLADQGVRFGLEYVGPKTLWSSKRYPFIHSMAELKDLLAAIGQENVGFVLDSWHWFTAGETREDLLTLTNKDVVACDLNDAPAGVPLDQQIDSRRELPAATGVIDLKVFLGALVEIGYDGPVRAEPFNKRLNDMNDEDAIAATSAAIRKAFALVE